MMWFIAGFITSSGLWLIYAFVSTTVMNEMDAADRSEMP